MNYLNFFVGISFFFFCTSCKSTDTVIPIGVSTFVSKEDFKNQLGFYVVPRSISFDGNDNLYVADSYRIFKITPSGKISLFAGTGLPGYRNGQTDKALFNGIQGIAFDAIGNLFVGEQTNTCIRKITPDGQVSLFAGKPYWYFNAESDGPEDGPDSSAHFAYPAALAFNRQGTLIETERGFINHFQSNAVRQITTKGYVKTTAGRVGDLRAGNFTDTPDYFADIMGLAIGNVDTVVVSDVNTCVIYKVAPTGQVTTLAGNGKRVAFDAIGKQASFYYPAALAYNSAKVLYVGDRYKIRQITTDGQVKTLTGGDQFGYQDGALVEARFGQIFDLKVNSSGVLYVADPDNNCIRRIKLE